MTLRIRSQRNKTVIEFEGEDGMTASWPFEDGLEGEALVAKLESVLRFYRAQSGVAPGPASPPAWRPEGHTAPLTPTELVRQLPAAAPPKAPSLADSLAAMPNGWELMGDDD